MSQITSLLSSEPVLQRLIFESTPDAILISNQAGHIIDANSQAEVLLGYDLGELKALMIEDLIPERFRAYHPKLREQFTQTGASRMMGAGRTVKALCKNGKELNVEITLSRIESSGTLLFVSVIRDVTERIQLQNALVQSEKRFRELANSSPVMIWMTDEAGQPIFSNRAWYEFTGLVEQDISHQQWLETIHPEDREVAFAAYYAPGSTSSRGPIIAEYRMRDAHGKWRWVLDSGVPQYDIKGEFSGYIGSVVDIHERKQTELRLAESEARFRAVINSEFGAIIIMNSGGKIVGWNPAATRIFGYRKSDILGQSVAVLLPEGDRATAERILKVLVAGRRLPLLHKISEHKGRRKNGECFLFDLTLAQWQTEEDVFLSGVARDITQRKHIETELRIAAAAFEANEPMVITDANNVILKINRAFAESTGYTPEQAIGQKINLLKSGRHDARFYQHMWQQLKTKGTWQGEIWDRRKNGEIYPKWLIITAVYDDAGQVTHYVGIHIDITERKAQEQQIKALAYYDPLTQLANRRLLQKRIDQALQRNRRRGGKLALLMLDLDRFKPVNDCYGHVAGDALLQQVAQRLQERVRDTDLAARLGGDEFVILLEEITDQHVATCLSKELIALLEKPFVIDGTATVCIGTSVGISLYPEHGDNADQLLHHADIALYQAKESGRGRYALFSSQLEQTAQTRQDFKEQLQNAFEQRQLMLHYQPVVTLSERRIIGAEVLLRWRSPALGWISPREFIPAVESNGMMTEIGLWVLEQALAQGRQWLNQGLPPLYLTLNISSLQLKTERFSRQLEAVLTRTEYPAKWLQLDISEPELADQYTDMLPMLTSLKALGLTLTLDHSAMDHASLRLLKSIPVAQLKIDPDCLARLPEQAAEHDLIHKVINTAHDMDCKVIAVGVENQQQLEWLQVNNFDYFQGFIHNPAVPPSPFAELLAKRSPLD
ncbi:MAG: PAS domain S-box protein [Methylococcales bacterium]|nr:PAS domain S-box protein [Methylococcales bacterium]